MADQAPNEEGEAGSHREIYLDQILRRLQSEQELETTATPPPSSTYAASSAMAAAAAAAGSMSSYAQPMQRRSSFGLAAPAATDLGGRLGSGSTKPRPFISSSSHPGVALSFEKQELNVQQEISGQSESEHICRVDTPALRSSSFSSGDPLTSDFPWLMEEPEKCGAGGAQLNASAMSYMMSSRFPNRPEDQLGSRAQHEFDADQLRFRMTPSHLEAPAEAATRGRTSPVLISEALQYGTPMPDRPQHGRMWLPASFESTSSMHMSSYILPVIKAEDSCGPSRWAGEIDPPAVPAAAGRSTINPETTPNSSFSSGSLSAEGEDVDAVGKRSTTSRSQDQTEASPAPEEGASSTKRKVTQELSLQQDELGADESTKSEAPPGFKKQPSLNRPPKKSGMKRVREPRYSIKTRTDVDIMDDGFKWRKYGQKAVKHSPHPRNYYRCTTPNCPVRKRVERSCEDSSLVITTYEGTHAHQTPGFNRSGPSLLHGFFGEAARAPFMGLGGHHGQLFGLPLQISGSLLGPGGSQGSDASHQLLRLPSFLQPASFNLDAGLAGLRGAAAGEQDSSTDQPPPKQLAVGSACTGSLRREELVRAQRQLLGQLPDTFTIGAVKQEPFQFAASSTHGQDSYHFLPRLSSTGLPRGIPTHDQIMQNLDQDDMIRSAATPGADSSSSSAAYMNYQQLIHPREMLVAAGGVCGSISTEAGSPQLALPFTGLGFSTSNLMQQQQQMVTNPGVPLGCLQGESSSFVSRSTRAVSPAAGGQEIGMMTRAGSNPASSSNKLLMGDLQAAGTTAAGTQQQHQHPEFVRDSTLPSLPRNQQDVRQLILEADRQQQHAARLNTIYSWSSGSMTASASASAAAGGQRISEENLEKSSEDSRGGVRRATVDQGLLEDMVRPRSSQGPAAAAAPPAAPGM